MLTGSYEDPVTGHAHDYEFVWTVPSPDRYTWSVVFLDGGKRTMVMEGEYRRRQPRSVPHHGLTLILVFLASDCHSRSGNPFRQIDSQR